MWKEVARITPVTVAMMFASALAIFFAASGSPSVAAPCVLVALLGVTMLPVITSQHCRIRQLERELQQIKQRLEE